MSFYKIIVNGESSQGGVYIWDLPKDKEPGNWHILPQETNLVISKSGFHVTTAPEIWLRHNCDIYECEIKDFATENEEEYVCREIRLLNLRNDLKPDYWVKIENFLNNITFDFKNTETKYQFFNSRKDALSSFLPYENKPTNIEIPHHVWTEVMSNSRNAIANKLNDINIDLSIKKEITVDFISDSIAYASLVLMGHGDKDRIKLLEAKMYYWKFGIGNLFNGKAIVLYRIV